ncbi:MAG: hypothetical protein LUH04_08265 [Clostridium sp.]|nr:hypothetical protein [Clostridium sp.]
MISSIGGQQQLEHALKADAHEEHTPGYEIDFHLQTSYNRRARRVLDTLSGATLITGADIQNISLQPDTSDTRERLYPDILLGNKDNSSFVLIEIKKDSQSEREAITELMAYALEIKNHLPQIADSDIHLILLSTTFNTLLTHSFCSLLLGTRFSLLALKATSDRDTLNLHIHFPESWTDIWQKELPPHALSSINILAYESEKGKAVEDPHQLRYILQDLAASEGNKNQSNGCLLIWENVSPSRKEVFGVTIYQINPFVFLDAISLRKRSHLKQNPLHTSGSGKIMKTATPYGKSCEYGRSHPEVFRKILQSQAGRLFHLDQPHADGVGISVVCIPGSI